MLKIRTPSAERRPRSGERRTVTLDPLTAASHPDAVVNGTLLAVIGTLVLTGLTGLIEPVISLDLFRPDVAFSVQVRSIGEIAVALLALVAAGLGLARHPRFPTLLLGVAAGISVLISFEAAHGLLTLGDPDAFAFLGLLVILAVPYVTLSRRCRLIFRRRLDLSDLAPVAGTEDWTVPQTATVMPPGPTAPTPDQAAAPKRSRPRRNAPRGGKDDREADTVASADPSSAALWAALYGDTASSAHPRALPGPEPTTATTPSGSGGRRVGLESLINLRPPGS